jgi:hypothetical protein
MFAGLETLVLDLRRQESKEYVLPPDSWGKLKKYLRKSIKSCVEPMLEKEQRNSIYEKLEELNRVSLKEAFHAFREKQSIYLGDLWPVFGNSEGVGLADIRNQLIHGVPLADRNIEAISIAKEHLRLTLERSLVRVLGWDIGKTNVSPERIEIEYVAVAKLSWARGSLTK